MLEMSACECNSFAVPGLPTGLMLNSPGQTGVSL